jgi:hypothetical protein
MQELLVLLLAEVVLLVAERVIQRVVAAFRAAKV